MAKGKLIGHFQCSCGKIGDVRESTKVNKASGKKFCYQRCPACGFQGMTWTEQSDAAVRAAMSPLAAGDNEPISATQSDKPKKHEPKKDDDDEPPDSERS